MNYCLSGRPDGVAKLIIEKQLLAKKACDLGGEALLINYKITICTC